MGLLQEFFTFLLRFYLGIFQGIFEFFVPKSYKDVTNEIVLVTGAANGLGRLLSLDFAERGAKVVLWDIDEKGLDGVLEEGKRLGLKGSMHRFVCDVGSRDAIYKVGEKIKEEIGVVTILVNNAGIVNGKNLVESDDRRIEKLIDINLMAHFWTIKCFLPDMMSNNRGHLVSLSSSAAMIAVNRLTDYCASKSGASAVLEGVHYELLNGGFNGIHTTTVCPYFIDTGMFTGCISRFNFLFPKLEPEQTAKRIMQAILTNQEIVAIPRMIYMLGLMKMLLPVKSTDAIHQFFGASSLMDTFVGRKKEN